MASHHRMHARCPTARRRMARMHSTTTVPSSSISNIVHNPNTIPPCFNNSKPRTKASMPTTRAHISIPTPAPWHHTHSSMGQVHHLCGIPTIRPTIAWAMHAPPRRPKFRMSTKLPSCLPSRPAKMADTLPSSTSTNSVRPPKQSVWGTSSTSPLSPKSGASIELPCPLTSLGSPATQ